MGGCHTGTHPPVNHMPNEECHDHIWTATMHMDVCHHYSNHFSCVCGAKRVRGGERPFYYRGKPTYSIVWVLEDCDRCKALSAATNRARRKPDYDITVLPDGTEINNRRARK